MDIQGKVRKLLAENVGPKVPVDQIGLEDDLFQIGMNSANSVELVLAIEGEFGFEFPDEDLNPKTLKSISSIVSYIQGRI